LNADETQQNLLLPLIHEHASHRLAKCAHIALQQQESAQHVSWYNPLVLGLNRSNQARRAKPSVFDTAKHGKEVTGRSLYNDKKPVLSQAKQRDAAINLKSN